MAQERHEIGVELKFYDSATGQMNTTGQAMQASAEKMQRMGSQYRAVGVGLTVMGAAGVYTSSKMVEGAAATEEAYAKVSTMMSGTASATDVYKKEIQALTKEIPIQGGEVAALDAMYQILSAGIEGGADATAVLEASMKGAVGGMTDTKVMADMLTTVLNAYSMEGSQATYVSDVLFQAIKSGKTTAEELAGSIGQVTAVASALGVSIEEVSAGFATVTKQGISTAETGTMLKAIMSSMLKPTDELSGLMGDLGYSSATAMLDAMSLQEALEMIAGAVEHDQEAQ